MTVPHRGVEVGRENAHSKGFIALFLSYALAGPLFSYI